MLVAFVHCMEMTLQDQFWYEVNMVSRIYIVVAIGIGQNDILHVCLPYCDFLTVETWATWKLKFSIIFKCRDAKYSTYYS